MRSAWGPIYRVGVLMAKRLSDWGRVIWPGMIRRRGGGAGKAGGEGGGLGENQGRGGPLGRPGGAPGLLPRWNAGVSAPEERRERKQSFWPFCYF